MQISTGQSVLLPYDSIKRVFAPHAVVDRSRRSLKRIHHSQKVYTPYILSDKELKALFSAIDEYPVNPRLVDLQPALFSTLFRLIYACGLRPHEGRTLLERNVNLKTGEIFIASAKKRKDRMVVLSEDMRALMIRYANKKALLHSDSPYFFPCRKGIPYTEKMLSWHFKNFVAAANPEIERESLPNVRIYDLRHRFATTIMTK
ncbi:MAG: tyrosine-type recombinase/integrase [Eubacterium sp.]|nr:tyrosine-type recombinase/integrase [Eubacterium sp.]